MSTEMDIDTSNPAASTPSTKPASQSSRLPVAITKPIPYTFDLGNLLCNDANALPPVPTPAELAATARDCAQALVNQLLTTCRITPHGSDGAFISLPPPTTRLPREKAVPVAAPPTRWERFARKKGIAPGKRRDEAKVVYDEAKGEWVRKWGYKGRNKDGEGEWIAEVNERSEKEAGGKMRTARAEGRTERREKVRRNERKQRANERGGRKEVK